MSRPRLDPGVLAQVTDQAAARIIKKLDREPRVAESWTWTSDDASLQVGTGAETVTLTSENGVVQSLEQVACTCLLAPRCFHVLAVLTVLEPADAIADDGDNEAPTPSSAPAAEPVLPDAQREAAVAMWNRAARVLTAGAASAGTVQQAELLRAVHTCRGAGLHRLSAAGLGIVRQIRELQGERPEFALDVLTDAVRDLLGTAHELGRGRGRAELVGRARRSYAPLGGLRLSGLFTQAVVASSGYAGVVTWLCDGDGRVWNLNDVKPGGVERVLQAYDAPAELGDVAHTHRQVGRRWLWVQDATGSDDGRLGKGSSVAAAGGGASHWDEAPIAALFERSLDTQLAALFDAPDGDLVTFVATTIGTDGDGLLVETPDGRCVKCLPPHAQPELPAVDNVALLCRAAGLRLRIAARVVRRRADTVLLDAVGPAPTDDAPQLRLPEAWHGRCNVALDRLQRSQLSRAEPDAVSAPRTPRKPAIDPLAQVRRRVERAVLGGAATLPPGAAGEIAREVALLKRRQLAAGAQLLDRLARSAQWTRQDRFGTREPVDPGSFALAWLAIATYERAAREWLERETWLPGGS